MAHAPSSERQSIPHVIVHVLRGKATTSARDMKGRSLLIGSGPGCEIQMRSAEVAAKHALLTRGPEGVFVRQLDLDHPLLVNGSATTEVALAHGDSLQVGPFELSVEIEGLPSAHVHETGPPSEPVAEEPLLSGLGSAKPRELQTLARMARVTPVATSTTSIASAVSANPLPSPPVPEIAGNDRELERRKRQMRDDMACLEAERARTQQERTRLDSQRQDVDRIIKEVDLRRADLDQRAHDLDELSRRLQREQDRIDAERVLATEESVAVDRKREAFESRKLRVIRLRRRLVTLYRQRRGDLDRRSQEIHEQSARLQQERSHHDVEVAQWRKLADDLSHRQAELKRADAEFARRVEHWTRKEREIQERQTKFESEVAVVHAKEKALETYSADLDRRKARIADEETALRETRRSLEEQLERVRQRSAEVQTRSLAVDRHEQQLHDQAAAIETQRIQLADWERRLSVRQSEHDKQAVAFAPHETGTHPPIRHIHAPHETRIGLGDQLTPAASKVVTAVKSPFNADDLAAARTKRQYELSQIITQLDGHAEHENRWKEALKRGRGDLNNLQVRYQKWRSSWDMNLDLQKRRVSHLKSIASRPHHADGRQSLQARSEAEESRLAAIESQLASVESQMESIASSLHENEEENARFSETLRSEVTQVTRLNDAIDALAHLSGDEMELASRTMEWTERVRKLRERFAVREAMIRDLQAALAQRILNVDLAIRDLDASGRTSSNSQFEARKAPDIADDVLAAGILDAGILDTSKLRGRRHSASQHQVTLAEELLRSQEVTSYQMDRIAESHADDLRLGSATVVDVLHEGTVATTFLVKLAGAEGLAAARMLRAQWSRDPAQRRQFEITIESLRDFHHPHIVATRGCHFAKERFGVLTEYTPSRSLAELVPFEVPPDVLIYFCYQAVCAIVAAERGGFVHREIRPSRLLVDAQGNLRLLGYGEPTWLATIYRCEKRRNSGLYCAPEVLSAGLPVDARADIYSIGRICQEAGTTESHAGCISEHISEAFRKLIEAMAAANVSDRPKPAEALKILHPIIDPSCIAHWPDFILAFNEASPWSARSAA